VPLFGGLQINFDSHPAIAELEIHKSAVRGKSLRVADGEDAALCEVAEDRVKMRPFR
jgi:hypothetical protein